MAVQAVLPSAVDHCSRVTHPQVSDSDARLYSPGASEMVSLFQDLQRSQVIPAHTSAIQQPKLTAAAMHALCRGTTAVSTQGPCQPSWLGGSAIEQADASLASRKRSREASDTIAFGSGCARQPQRVRGSVEFSSDLAAVVASRCPSPSQFVEAGTQHPQGAPNAAGTRRMVGRVGMGPSVATAACGSPGSKDPAVLASLLASMADDRTQIQNLLARRLGGLGPNGLASTSGRGSGVTTSAAPNGGGGLTLKDLSNLSNAGGLTIKELNNLSMLQQLAAVTQGEGLSQLLRAQQQGEQIKALLEERRQHQVLAAINNEYTQRLRVAGFEIERQRLRTAELEGHVKRLINELAISHSRLRNSEMVVNTLRSNLEHAVALSREEQTGDSDDADDAASSYESDLMVSHARALRENEELREQRACRVCRSKEATTLLLPCRHLCLCHDCEGQLDSCPLCRQPKAASVLVYMS